MNERCQQCVFHCSAHNTCDYCIIVSRPRHSPSADCDKFIPASLLSHRTTLVDFASHRSYELALVKGPDGSLYNLAPLYRGKSPKVLNSEGVFVTVAERLDYDELLQKCEVLQPYRQRQLFRSILDNQKRGR